MEDDLQQDFYLRGTDCSASDPAADLQTETRRRKTQRRASVCFVFVSVCMGRINISVKVFKWLCGVLDLDEAWLNLLSPHSCGAVRISAESHFSYRLYRSQAHSPTLFCLGAAARFSSFSLRLYTKYNNNSSIFKAL